MIVRTGARRQAGVGHGCATNDVRPHNAIAFRTDKIGQQIILRMSIKLLETPLNTAEYGDNPCWGIGLPVDAFRRWSRPSGFTPLKVAATLQTVNVTALFRI
jgi:hypothetical protein